MCFFNQPQQAAPTPAPAPVAPAPLVSPEANTKTGGSPTSPAAALAATRTGVNSLTIGLNAGQPNSSGLGIT